MITIVFPLLAMGSPASRTSTVITLASVVRMAATYTLS